MNNRKSKKRIVTIIRWSARIVGVAYLAFFLLMFIGETFFSSKQSNPMNLREIVGFIFLFTYFAGLILAWKWEGTGGFIAICCMIAFRVTIDTFPLTVLMLMVIPVLLFLACWLLSRSPIEIKEKD